MFPTHVDPRWIPRHGAVPRHVHEAVSRRRFLAGAAGALGVAAAAPVLTPLPAVAAKKTDPTPNPITGGFTIGGTTFHVLSFGPWIEPSTVTDFNGFSGVCDVQGTGTATNPDGSTETLLYDTDMRFMRGTYRGVDGAMHHGTFGFV
jgi:hypothetical protein